MVKPSVGRHAFVYRREGGSSRFIAASTMTATDKDLDRLADGCGRACEADARFFERHPDRNYRARLASRAEAEAAILGGINRPGPGERIFILIKQIAPGARLRHTIVNNAHAETDLSEREARDIYEAWALPFPHLAAAERMLRQEAAERDRGAT